LDVKTTRPTVFGEVQNAACTGGEVLSTTDWFFSCVPCSRLSWLDYPSALAYAKHLLLNFVVYFAGFVAENLTVDVAIPTQTYSVTVMSVFGWIMIHQHVDDTFDWNLPWVYYKVKFGPIDGNFWLGLENMHLLTTSQPYRLRPTHWCCTLCPICLHLMTS